MSNRGKMLKLTKFGAISTRAKAETVETALDVYQQSGTGAAASAANVHRDTVRRWAIHFGIWRDGEDVQENDLTDWIERGEKLVKQHGPAEGNCKLLAEWTRSVVPGAAA